MTMRYNEGFDGLYDQHLGFNCLYMGLPENVWICLDKIVISIRHPRPLNIMKWISEEVHQSGGLSTQENPINNLQVGMVLQPINV